MPSLRTTPPDPQPRSAVPGTFLGTRYPDIRELLPTTIKRYYQDNGMWPWIITCKFYEESDVVWYYDPKHKVYVKHKWGYRGGKRYIQADNFQRERPR